VLVDDRAHPSQIGPGGQRIVVEIARTNSTDRRSRSGRSAGGLLMASGRSKIVARDPARREGRPRSTCRRPTDIQQMRELGRTDVRTRSSAIGPETLVHGGDECGAVGFRPRILACRTAGSPLRTIHANCDHMRIKAHLVQHHRSAVPGALSDSHGRRSTGTLYFSSCFSRRPKAARASQEDHRRPQVRIKGGWRSARPAAAHRPEA